MNTSTVLGKTIVFAGLSLAVVLGICGFRSNWTTVKLAGKSASISELDQRARPFFEVPHRSELCSEKRPFLALYAKISCIFFPSRA